MFAETTLNPGFAGQQKRMATLTNDLKAIGFNPQYFVSKFGIDSEFYKDFLGDPGDFSELAELYLPAHVTAAIKKDVEALRGLYH